MKLVFSYLIAVVIIGFASPSSALTMTYNIDRVVGSNTFTASFTIDLPTNSVSGSTTGLTVNSINFPVDNGIQYSYYPQSGGFLSIDGGLPNFSTTGNDFTLSIQNAASSNPTLFGFGLRLPSQGINTGISTNGVTFSAFAGTPPAPVPLPASLPLLLSALAGLLFMRSRKWKLQKLTYLCIPNVSRGAQSC